MDSRSKLFSLSDLNGRGEAILSADQIGHIITEAQVRLLVARGEAVLLKRKEELDGAKDK